MEKLENIVLTSEELCDFVHESYLKINDVEYTLQEQSREHYDSRRHTECYTVVYYIVETDQYFKVDYEISCKDSMGWEECNNSNRNQLIEVFPKEITIVTYVTKSEL